MFNAFLCLHVCSGVRWGLLAPAPNCRWAQRAAPLLPVLLELQVVMALPLALLAPLEAAAQLPLLAQVPGAQMRMDQREGTGVDLLLGDGFPGLAAPEAAQQALEQPVQPPEGC